MWGICCPRGADRGPAETDQAGVEGGKRQLDAGVRVARRYAEIKGEDPSPDEHKRNAQVSSWETGKVWPDLQTLHWLAAVYNMTFEQLIDGAVITKNEWLARHAGPLVQEPVVPHEDR